MSETEWNRGDPQPTPDDHLLGPKKLKWYEVLYNNGTKGLSCWWNNHWYCNSEWMNIVAWREKEDTA